LFIKTNSKAGNVVLINGASGGVGIPTIQLAKASGLKVIGTAGNDENLNLIKKQGVDYAFNYKDPNHVNEIKKLFPNGVDLVVEMQASANLMNDISLLKPIEGKIVVVGSRGEMKFNPAALLGSEADIVGLSVYSFTKEELAKASSDIGPLLKANKLRPVLGPKYPLKDAAKVHANLESTTSLGGRITLTI
jgi:NADPH:quinone reductase